MTGIGRQGDGYIRRLAVIGATAVIHLPRKDNASKARAAKLLERRSARLVSGELVKETASIAREVFACNQDQYQIRADALNPEPAFRVDLDHGHQGRSATILQ